MVDREKQSTFFLPFFLQAGDTSLIVAAAKDSKDVAQMLLDKGADIEAKNDVISTFF